MTKLTELANKVLNDCDCIRTGKYEEEATYIDTREAERLAKAVLVLSDALEIYSNPENCRGMVFVSPKHIAETLVRVAQEALAEAEKIAGGE